MIAWSLPHGPDAPVAFGGAGDRHAGDLLRDAAAVAAGLPAPTPGSHVLLVLEQDRYTLAAAMLGAWLAGHAVAFPPHGRRAGVAFVLTRPEIVALVHDTQAGGHLQVATLLARPVATPPAALRWPEGPIWTWFRLADDGQGVVPFAQTAAQVQAECRALLERLPALRGARITAQAEPFAPAAILLGILLPLLGGGSFERRPADATGDVLVTTPAGELADGGFVTATSELAGRGLVPTPAGELAGEGLVPTPAGALAGEGLVPTATSELAGGEPVPTPAGELAGEGLVPVRARPWDFAVYATDLGDDPRLPAELPPQAAALWQSAATGSLATRTAGTAWDPLPGVDVAPGSSERLQAQVSWGPQPSVHGPRKIRATAGGFEIAGRPEDRPGAPGAAALERAALAQPGVRDVVATLRDTGEILEAFVWAAGSTDADALRARLEAVLVAVPAQLHLALDPRLPREPEGGVPRWRVLRRFGRGHDGELRADALRIAPAERRPGDDVPEIATTEVDVPSDYRWFVGHFDGYPILAGVIQLHELVVPVAREVWPQLGDVRELQKLKFLGRIVPGDRLSLTLRLDPRTLACDFSLDKSEQPCSAGRLCFARNAP